MHPLDIRGMVAWITPDQVDLLRAVSRAAQIPVLGVGTPDAGRASELGAALNAESFDDLRACLASASSTLVYLMAPAQFGADPEGSEARVLADARQRGVTVATTEPMPASVLQTLAPSAVLSPAAVADPAAAWARTVPLARHTRPVREAMEALTAFGEVRAVSVSCLCGPAEGSLGARLFDALDLVLTLMGDAALIDAAYVARDAAKGLHALPGDSLRGLNGEISANLRFADGRAACTLASDQAGRWECVLTAIGPAGRMRIYNDGFEWISPKGDKLDEARHRRPRRGPAMDPETPLSALIIAEQLARLLDGTVPPESSSTHARTLATAEAALLSARTGESESPGTILKMAGTS
ncbi:MAG: hypothetical protein JNM07_03850 [Phycisphaerae bacterium]|nr:hypothetical protein [Phycisphaerae bacterium]